MRPKTWEWIKWELWWIAASLVLGLLALGIAIATERDPVALLLLVLPLLVGIPILAFLRRVNRERRKRDAGGVASDPPARELGRGQT